MVSHHASNDPGGGRDPDRITSGGSGRDRRAGPVVRPLRGPAEAAGP